MRVLITGAAGFLGTRLIEALLDEHSGLRVSAIVAADTAPCLVEHPHVEVRQGTITDPVFVSGLTGTDLDLVFHLAAVLSGQAEAEFDTGMRVNVDATRLLLESCRHTGRAPRLVYTSSIAVFGSPLAAVVPGDFAPRPQTSYGAEKVIGEVLVADYGRRGFVDGISVRLPTVAVRPGRPNSALSSFVSGIIREPLAGVDAVCPVPLDTRIWISSPDTTIANLLHAARLPGEALASGRTFNLPGLSVTAADMLASLERIGGLEARRRVRLEPDATITRAMRGWPAAIDTTRERELGFRADAGIDDIVRQFQQSAIAKATRSG